MNNLIRAFTLIFLLAISSGIIILWGRGYRIDLKKKEFSGTGSLVATSDPNGAQIFINNEYKTATNSTIQLPPGKYHVRIVKEGYIPWEKEITVKKEVVSQANATLFPKNPSLSPLTSVGINKPLSSPKGDKILFIRTAEKENTLGPVLKTKTSSAGLWVLDFTKGPIGVNRESKQIVNLTSKLDWEKAQLVWSPDEKEIMAIFLNPKTNKMDKAFLLKSDKFNKQIRNISLNYQDILKSWEKVEESKTEEKLLPFPKQISKVLKSSGRILSFSADETKILYQATRSATLKLAINPPLIGTNPTVEEREIKPKSVYVYDSKEDKNFKIKDSKVFYKTRAEYYQLDNSLAIIPYQWYPDSRHLIFIEEKTIFIMEYDSQNKTAIYGGPFYESFLAPWPEGGKLIILTTLNTAVSDKPNLYLINLR